MKPSHLALAAFLGMAITGGSVYVLTTPRAPATSPGLAASVDANSSDALSDAAAARPSEQTPNPAQSAAPEPDASATARASATGPAPSRLPPPRPWDCAVPDTEYLFGLLIEGRAPFRDLSPEEKERFREELRRGSAQCACRPVKDGEALCMSWCLGKGFTRGGRCEQTGLCACN